MFVGLDSTPNTVDFCLLGLTLDPTITSAPPATTPVRKTPAPKANGKTAGKPNEPAPKLGSVKPKVTAPTKQNPEEKTEEQKENVDGDDKIQWDLPAYYEHNVELLRQTVTFGPWDADNDALLGLLGLLNTGKSRRGFNSCMKTSKHSGPAKQ
jgi:hypothetical protein